MMMYTNVEFIFAGDALYLVNKKVAIYFHLFCLMLNEANLIFHLLLLK